METSHIVFVTAVIFGAILTFSPLWRWVRFFETIIHEFGHAAVGVLFGQKLRGFKIRYDTSGETNTLTYGYGMRGLLTHLSGYPTPVLLGVLTIYYTAFYGASTVFMWVYALISLITLVFMRNWFGFIPVTIMAGLTISTYFVNNSYYTEGIVLALAATLLLGGLRSVVNLWSHSEGSDADLIAHYLGGYRTFWVFLITLATIVTPIVYIWGINMIIGGI